VTGEAELLLFESLAKFQPSMPLEYDAIALVTQHPDRPHPVREADQIYMLPGSQLTQAKLLSEYLAGRDVVFVGDGDSMALSVIALLKQGVFKPAAAPRMMRVLDFDRRIVNFINNLAVEWNVKDRLQAHLYNVADPVPRDFVGQHDVFYVNPPYGSKNAGFSGVAFIARGMELCKGLRSQGIAVLPYTCGTAWTESAMRTIQSFLLDNGYVVSEMLTGMHRYHLDDRPDLRSGTLIADRVEAEPRNPYAGRALTEPELSRFYGDTVRRFPRGIELDGSFFYGDPPPEAVSAD
jgi:predicted methyltransferase